MTININKINQSNNFNTRLTRPRVKRDYSAIQKKYTVQGTGDMGKFIPIHYEELIPGQKISLRQQAGIQFMPFVSNLLHEIEGEILTYFVPYRILWDKWEDFITGGKDGTNNDQLPYINITTLFTEAGDIYPIEGRKQPNDEDLFLEGSLWDKFGMPIAPHATVAEFGSPSAKALAFPFMAYNMIWNEHIRIPDLEEERSWEIRNGEVHNIRMDLAPCHWSWDYFTRARIYQQRGVIPTVPIAGIDGAQEIEHHLQFGTWTSQGEWQKFNWYPQTKAGTFTGNTSNGKDEYLQADANTQSDITTEFSSAVGSTTVESGQGVSGMMRVLPHELNLAGMGIDLNDFLTALGIMRVQVNNAKIEARYSDHLQVRWGVYPEDARLQMPEYLGIQNFSINVDTVTNTAEQQGAITGQAWGSHTGGQKIEYEAKEHGIVISIMAIRPKTSYEQGLPRIMFANKTRFDFPTPELANLPDVQIEARELSYYGKSDLDMKSFGWTGIYEEYRTNINIVTGKLRPSIKDGLHSYTLARYWKNAPELNAEFIQCKPDKGRIMMYPEEPTFIYFIRNETKEAIPLPIQSEPAMLGTF